MPPVLLNPRFRILENQDFQHESGDLTAILGELNLPAFIQKKLYPGCVWNQFASLFIMFTVTHGDDHSFCCSQWNPSLTLKSKEIVTQGWSLTRGSYVQKYSKVFPVENPTHLPNQGSPYVCVCKKIAYTHEASCSPCQSSVDYESTKITRHALKDHNYIHMQHQTTLHSEDRLCSEMAVCTNNCCHCKTYTITVHVENTPYKASHSLQSHAARE